MRENKTKTIWAAGGEVLTGWLAIPSSLSAEMMAQQDFDAITIDMQHGCADYADTLSMLQAISTTDRTPFVRVPWNDPAIIGRVLDAGAYGVICPMVNTADECKAFVEACRYFPLGGRSVGPIRAGLYGGSDYFANANDTIITMAMIEHKDGLANLDAILSTPGLNAIFVGPSDLAVSMGHTPGFDPKWDDVIDAIQLIAERCEAHGVIPGIHVGSVEYGQKMRDMGYKFQAFQSDFRMLQVAYANALPAFRAGKSS
ncbi:HpcH/HpaI aldolase family protein [Falsihalocynthiibacter arcticus]|uniref:2,4-dihydroxyhept-2-ene-1,7-dioic acid aldolase n=1 Tax=Falsihalocynthiibacter arcticus TaxID=1579316 RepID=A0A126UWG3_9RHOB|nr:aldolase/citrate lyase family protein [Falsihalocynthiibacter arcticus]AML50421.1 2,4-dihydroxyhept-2-ene-1,7-dioic acid aldolase [Falsihalocynthiibacter arcticus]